MNRISRQGLKIAAIYLGISALWIILSDRMLLMLAPALSAEAMAEAQSFKGMVFVAITAVLLCWLVRRSLHRELESRDQYHNLFELSPNGIYVQVEGIIRFINPAGLKFLRASKMNEVVGHHINEFLHPDFHNLVRQRIALMHQSGMPAPALEERWKLVDGTEATAEVTATPVIYNGSPAIQVILRDLSAQREHAEQLSYLAAHDSLTGLPNLLLLKDRLAQDIIHARRLNRLVALLVVNIAGMRYVNDSYGYTAGDDLLKALGQDLLEAVRPGDTVARIAGDEFAVLLSDLGDRAGMLTTIERLLARIPAAHQICGQTFHLNLHSGAAVWPEDGEDAQTLIDHAMSAVHRAKQAGNPRTEFYTQSISDAARRRLTLEWALIEGLAHSEFMLHYQPLVSAASGQARAYEALIRWNSPTLGMVPPAEFIPLAEETGHILAVGDWVLEEACRQMAQWRSDISPDLQVGVNLSAVQLRDESLPGRILELLQRHRLPPQSLILEITESMLMADSAQNAVQRLMEAGIQLSLDDFGTGYSSFSYLKKFRMNHLKIDMSFVRDIVTDEGNARITQSIIGLGHSIGMEVVAEGVETIGQARLLSEWGCDLLQGYYFSKPVASSSVGELLSKKFKWAGPMTAT